MSLFGIPEKIPFRNHFPFIHRGYLDPPSWTEARAARRIPLHPVSQIRLSRFSLAKPRNTLVSAVSSFTPARRCLLGVADGLAAPSQLKRHRNAMVNKFIYFVASRSSTFQLISTTS